MSQHPVSHRHLRGHIVVAFASGLPLAGVAAPAAFAAGSAAAAQGASVPVRLTGTTRLAAPAGLAPSLAAPSTQAAAANEIPALDLLERSPKPAAAQAAAAAAVRTRRPTRSPAATPASAASPA